jgi:hypothetical protein
VDHIEVWDNGQKIDQVYGNHLDKSYSFSNGQHTVSLVAGEQTRLVFEKLNTTLQVQTPGGGACPASPNGNTVLICEPAANSSVSSPVHVTATATGGSFPIVHMRVYIDTNPEFDTDLSTIDTSINLGAGQHFIVVVAWNSNGDAFISGPNRNFTVTNSTGGPCGSPATDKTINICSPLSGSTQNSPVQVSARARWDCCVVSHMRVYVDDVDKFDVDNPFNNDISPSLQLSSGSHNMVIIAWDNQGDFIESAVQFTVP